MVGKKLIGEFLGQGSKVRQFLWELRGKTGLTPLEGELYELSGAGGFVGTALSFNTELGKIELPHERTDYPQCAFTGCGWPGE